MGISLGDVSASGTNAVVEQQHRRRRLQPEHRHLRRLRDQRQRRQHITVRNNFVSGVTGRHDGRRRVLHHLRGVRDPRGDRDRPQDLPQLGQPVRACAGHGDGHAACCPPPSASRRPRQTGCDVRNNIFSNTHDGRNDDHRPRRRLPAQQRHVHHEPDLEQQRLLHRAPPPACTAWPTWGRPTPRCPPGPRPSPGSTRRRTSIPPPPRPTPTSGPTPRPWPQVGRTTVARWPPRPPRPSPPPPTCTSTPASPSRPWSRAVPAPGSPA